MNKSAAAQCGVHACSYHSSHCGYVFMLLAGLLQSVVCVWESGVRERVCTDAKWTAILMEQWHSASEGDML